MNEYEFFRSDTFFMILMVVGLPTFIYLVLKGLDYVFEEVPHFVTAMAVVLSVLGFSFFMEGLSEAAGPREPVLKPPSAEQSAVVPASKP